MANIVRFDWGISLQQGAGDTTHYLDTQTGTVITMSLTSPDYILELVAARRRQEDQTLLKVHRAGEQDEAEDWQDFLETIRDTIRFFYLIRPARPIS